MTESVIPTPLLLTVEERNKLQMIGGSFIGGVRKLLEYDYTQFALVMAFARGGQARKDSQSEYENPYPFGSPAALVWVQGWERRDLDEQRCAALHLAATALDSWEPDDKTARDAWIEALSALQKLGYEVHGEPNLDSWNLYPDPINRVIFDAAKLPEM